MKAQQRRQLKLGVSIYVYRGFCRLCRIAKGVEVGLVKGHVGHMAGGMWGVSAMGQYMWRIGESRVGKLMRGARCGTSG